jgi:hypothetical protein
MDIITFIKEDLDSISKENFHRYEKDDRIYYAFFNNKFYYENFHNIELVTSIPGDRHFLNIDYIIYNKKLHRIEHCDVVKNWYKKYNKWTFSKRVSNKYGIDLKYSYSSSSKLFKKNTAMQYYFNTLSGLFNKVKSQFSYFDAFVKLHDPNRILISEKEKVTLEGLPIKLDLGLLKIHTTIESYIKSIYKEIPLKIVDGVLSLIDKKRTIGYQLTTANPNYRTLIEKCLLLKSIKNAYNKIYKKNHYHFTEALINTLKIKRDINEYELYSKYYSFYDIRNKFKETDVDYIMNQLKVKVPFMLGDYNLYKKVLLSKLKKQKLDDIKKFYQEVSRVYITDEKFKVLEYKSFKIEDFYNSYSKYASRKVLSNFIHHYFDAPITAFYNKKSIVLFKKRARGWVLFRSSDNNIKYLITYGSKMGKKITADRRSSNISNKVKAIAD